MSLISSLGNNQSVNHNAAEIYLNISFARIVLKMDRIPLWMALSGSVGVGMLAAAIVRVFLVPYYKRQITTPTPVNFTLGLPDGKFNFITKNYTVFVVLESHFKLDMYKAV